MKNLIIISFLLLVGGYGFGQSSDTTILYWEDDGVPKYLEWSESKTLYHHKESPQIINASWERKKCFFNKEGKKINSQDFIKQYGQAEIDSINSELLIVQFNWFEQIFHLNYWTVGLGSNATWRIDKEQKDCSSGLKVYIRDTVLTYSLCERTEKFKIDTTFNDTIWTKQRNFYKVKFRRSSIDSIISILDTLQGKYIYRTNPHVRSGGITNYSIEYQGWCCQFVMKNTYDSTAFLLTNLINSYLDERYQLSVPNSRWSNNKYDNPLIENCPKESNGSYKEVLEQEYDVIRNN